MIRVTTSLLLLVLLAAGCGSPGSAAQGDDCTPSTPASVEPPGEPDRRIEDIIEHLTGERQMGDEDPVESTIDDPNFGGVWGDRRGGIVVAVLDCSLVDADRLAELAGGSDHLHLIEVPYTFRQVNAYRDALVRELDELGVEGDVYIHPTLEGRFIEVRVPDPDALPPSFGSEVPADVYEITRGEPSSEA